jgi:hypothetical protein
MLWYLSYCTMRHSQPELWKISCYFHSHFGISVLTGSGGPSWDCIMGGEYSPNFRCLHHTQPQSVSSCSLVLCFSAHRNWKTVYTFSLVCLFSGVAVIQLMLCWCGISFTGEYTCYLAVGPSSMTKNSLL